MGGKMENGTRRAMMGKCVVCKENKANFATNVSIAEKGVRSSACLLLCSECRMVADDLVEAVRMSANKVIWRYPKSSFVGASALSFTNPDLSERVMEDPFPEWDQQTQARQSGYSGEACDKCGMFT